MSNLNGLQKIALDIETVGVNYDDLDDISKAYIEKGIDDEDELTEAKQRLGLSPLTGQVVAIGLINPDTNKGIVYVNIESNKKELPDELEEGIVIETGSEKEILEKFWETAKAYNCFIDFNGRGFDIPYLMIRSMILGVKPTKNIMSNRYTSLQDRSAYHIDLWDQLSFYGSSRFEKSGLHFWTKALNIKSPKEGGVDGSDVKKLYENKEYLKIAEYNIADVKATIELFRKWEEYLS